MIGDYAEMVSQFTYICLWSAVFPLAPLFALIVNFTQIRGEMSLTCVNNKRHDPSKAGKGSVTSDITVERLKENYC